MISISAIKRRYRYSMVLLIELVRTNFKVRYQHSILGYLWSILKPLFMFLVLYVIFVKFLHIGSGIENWPVALFLGLVMWEFFNEVTKQGLKAVVNKGSLIRKINFPIYIVVVASSVSAFINLILNLVVVLIFVVITDAPISISYLLIPLYIVQLYIFGLGLALILSTIYVKIRDINFIWEVLMRGGFYASAVMFPISRVYDASAFAGSLLLMSPVSQTIQDSRHSMLANIPSSSSYIDSSLLILVPIFVTLVTFVAGVLLFKKKAPNFAEHV